MGLWKRPAASEKRSPRERTKPAERQETPAFITSGPALRTSLGPDDVITGRLNFSAPTRIDGTLRGEVRANELLVIGETALIDGNIRGTAVVVLGRVEGDVLGAARVEIGPRGVLRGSIDTQDLIVQEGGVLEGPCRAAPAKASVHTLQPRPGKDAMPNTYTPSVK